MKERGPALGPKHALLVGGHPGDVALYRHVLAGSGWTTVTVDEGTDALRLLSPPARFGVVLVDMCVRGMDWVSVLCGVRALDPGLPVVVTTGDPKLETAVQALEYQAWRYLAKPVDVAALVTAIEGAARVRSLSFQQRRALELVGEDPCLRAPDDPRLVTSADLGADLDEAMASIWMAYQPIVQLKQKRVIAYEALMRTRAPKLQTPLQILKASELLGRMNELGRSNRALVAQDAARLPDGVDLFVNLSASDLHDEELYDDSAPLSRFARRVVLEITERAPLGDVQDLRARITRLRELGFRLAIDDLGAGYASLSSFAQVRPDFIKVDLSIVRDVDSDPVKISIIRSLVSLMRELHMEIICEGVETSAECQVLTELGCDLMQGFLLAFPAPPFVVPTWENPSSSEQRRDAAPSHHARALDGDDPRESL